MKHCDDYIDDVTQPKCLRDFLHYNRLPAVCKMPNTTAPDFEDWISAELRQYIWRDPEPVLFADFGNVRVRVVMASRFGDVGITNNLAAEHGYSERVAVDALHNFSEAA